MHYGHGEAKGKDKEGEKEGKKKPEGLADKLKKLFK